MHRYIARLIGCVILALILTIPLFLAPYVTGLAGWKNQITVRTNGPTADIVAAVEALKREDISIRVVDQPPPLFLGGIVSFIITAGALWVGCGIVKRVEQSLSAPKKEDSMATE